MFVGELYARFASSEARGSSPIYEAWAFGVASDPEVIAKIAALPQGKQQPNLVFAAARFLGAPDLEPDYPEFREWLLGHWEAVRDEALRRLTQTNEPRRCATLLPVLAALPQPLALIEVGAAAGLCLYPDKFSYVYNGAHRIDLVTGPSIVELPCETTGAVPFPTQMPEIVWRAGIDLNPLDVTVEDDVTWLRTLVWPEQIERRDRLDGAIEIARQDPPQLVRGDLNETLRGLAAEAPTEATLVVFHSAVIAYLDESSRRTFVETVQQLPAHWISNEGPDVLSFIDREPPTSPDPTRALFLLELDTRPVAWAGPHGQSLNWLD